MANEATSKYLPIIISSKGSHISADIFGAAVRVKVEPWCKVFQHCTEYLIIGKFTAPTIDKIAAALPRLAVCSKAAYNAITTAYKNAKMSIDVKRASQTQYVPHVGFAQIEPVNKLITQSKNPIGASACATRLAVLIFHTR